MHFTTYRNTDIIKKFPCIEQAMVFDMYFNDREVSLKMFHVKHFIEYMKLW